MHSFPFQIFVNSRSYVLQRVVTRKYWLIFFSLFGFCIRVLGVFLLCFDFLGFLISFVLSFYLKKNFRFIFLKIRTLKNIYCINIVLTPPIIWHVVFLWRRIIINKYLNFHVDELYDYLGNFGNHCNLHLLKHSWLICVWPFLYLNFDLCSALDLFPVLLLGKAY